MKPKSDSNNTTCAVDQQRLVLPELFIVNVYDRPSEGLIAELRADGKFYYVHPDLRRDRQYWSMEPENPTPLGSFGIEVEICDGMLHGRKVAKSEAEYADGRRRLWQGSPEFSFSWKKRNKSCRRQQMKRPWATKQKR